MTNKNKVNKKDLGRNMMSLGWNLIKISILVPVLLAALGVAGVLIFAIFS